MREFLQRCINNNNFSETAKTHSLDRDQAKDGLGDMISEIDKKLRMLRFPATTDKIFDPNALDEYVSALLCFVIKQVVTHCIFSFNQ